MRVEDNRAFLRFSSAECIFLLHDARKVPYTTYSAAAAEILKANAAPNAGCIAAAAMASTHLRGRTQPPRRADCLDTILSILIYGPTN